MQDGEQKFTTGIHNNRLCLNVSPSFIIGSTCPTIFSYTNQTGETKESKNVLNVYVRDKQADYNTLKKCDSCFYTALLLFHMRRSLEKCPNGNNFLGTETLKIKNGL